MSDIETASEAGPVTHVDLRQAAIDAGARVGITPAEYAREERLLREQSGGAASAHPPRS